MGKYTSMFARVVAKTHSHSDLSDMNSISTNSASLGEELDSDEVSQQRRRAPVATGCDEENSYEEMTMKEIMTGKGDYFPGLIPLVRAYLDYIEQRATGALITPATWMRKFVRNHPAYKGDSYINHEIAYDLMVACKEIGEGTR